MSPGPVLPLLLLALPAQAPTADWPGWRGPDGSGVSAEKELPSRWSQTENVRWKAKVPGEGVSSPVVCKGRVFLTSSLDRGARRQVHCFVRETGKLLWSREIKDEEPEGTSAVTGHAASTPVTDGKCVVAFFGHAGVVCYDFAGKRLWHRKLGEFESDLGLASSPVFYKGRVLLVCDHDGDRFTSFDSFLVALDLATGQECWKTSRRGLHRSWGTPLLVPAGKKRELIVAGEDALRGYDPEDGKLLWQTAGLTGWVAPSPVFGHGLVFATSGKNGPVLAVKPGGRGKVAPAWRHDTGGPYYCSPLLNGDYLYVHDEHGFLSCYEARTGKRQYRERLRGKFTASAVGGAGKVYVTNEDGVTYVLKAGPKFTVLARNPLGEECLASPAIAGGELFVRTEHHLYCIAQRGNRQGAKDAKAGEEKRE
jgi:outer membrane protein assembly factor BamB